MTTPEEILDDAKHLSNHRDVSEARLRTVISRTYYAVYHFLQSHPCSAEYEFNHKERMGTHRHFMAWLGQSHERNVLFAAKYLNDLYSKRIWADYNLDMPPRFDVQSHQMVLEDAEYVFKEILLEYDAEKDER